MAFIFRITSNNAWVSAQLKGVFTDASLESEGFIHFSLESQIRQTYERFYKDQPDLVLLIVDTEKLADPSLLKYEDTSDHGTFPHLYGSLNLDAVLEAVEMRELSAWLDGKERT
jgi:uncharacterized protein (DUF952 family)